MSTTRTTERDPVLPPLEEAVAFVPPPGSITWRRAGDARLMVGAGYALLLQVAHPVVGAGVAEHSNFREDPWGRLVRTLDYTNTLVYGEPEEAVQMGRWVRNMHKRIKGVDSQGRRYHALDPEAYPWVHATLADAIVGGHARFGCPMNRAEVNDFYSEWLGLGRLLGVRERDLPGDWPGFRRYFDRMVAERLEFTETVRDVLASLAEPKSPPNLPLPDGAWRAARFPAARLSALATIGMLPPVLRERFGLKWSRAQELELRALGAVSRAATPAMPASLRRMGPAWLERRRHAIVRSGMLPDPGAEARTAA
jgi:uncharacterized protein (DUF2236 family)